MNKYNNNFLYSTKIFRILMRIEKEISIVEYKEYIDFYQRLLLSGDVNYFLKILEKRYNLYNSFLINNLKTFLITFNCDKSLKKEYKKLFINFLTDNDLKDFFITEHTRINPFMTFMEYIQERHPSNYITDSFLYTYPNRKLYIDINQKWMQVLIFWLLNKFVIEYNI